MFLEFRYTVCYWIYLILEFKYIGVLLYIDNYFLVQHTVCVQCVSTSCCIPWQGFNCLTTILFARYTVPKIIWIFANINRACHGCSRCIGKSLAYGPDICVQIPWQALFYADIQIIFGTVRRITYNRIFMLQPTFSVLSNDQVIHKLNR